ncbi:MAG: DNA polymerase III subunit delta [Deltaproteobacteria bacterium]|nr:DNA polymerase III subunit delta [Deltaproteobacteria bacterium]
MNLGFVLDIKQLLKEANAGKFAPVHLLVGTERFFIERAVSALRLAVMGDKRDALNDESFFGKNSSATRIVEAAKTLPMMAKMRFILVRGVESLPETQFETLATYFEKPSPSTCLVLTAEKLDGRIRLAKVAKKQGFWSDAETLKANQLGGFASAEARQRGHALEPEAARALVDAIGNDLSAIDDALERLSLFVGKGASIGLDAVEACVSRIRVESIWELVDAVGMKNQEIALRAANSLLSNGEPPLRILAMVARQLRMVARMRHALASGLSPQEAAKEAGAPTFKARDLTSAAKRFQNAELASAFRILSGTDIALKSSKRPPETILLGAITQLTGQFT